MSPEFGLDNRRSVKLDLRFSQLLTELLPLLLHAQEPRQISVSVSVCCVCAAIMVLYPKEIRLSTKTSQETAEASGDEDLMAEHFFKLTQPFSLIAGYGTFLRTRYIHVFQKQTKK